METPIEISSKALFRAEILKQRLVWLMIIRDYFVGAET